jgi:hypothetical protein
MPKYDENKASEKGMAKTGKQSGSGTVKSLEHVGSSHPQGHKFRMPKDHEISDHSDLDSPEHKRA